MPRRAAVIWSAVEVSYLRKNRKAPLLELAGQLAKSVGAIKKKLAELKKDPNKLPLLGPTKNKRSRIGKRADCGGQFFRSAWEANIYRWLRRVKGWNIEYEPRTFTFTEFGVSRGQLSYTPDFRIYTPEGHFWLEVKGYVASQDATKLRRFKKYFNPDFQNLRVVVGSRKTKAYKFFKEQLGLDETRILPYDEITRQYRESGYPGWEQ